MLIINCFHVSINCFQYSLPLPIVHEWYNVYSSVIVSFPPYGCTYYKWILDDAVINRQAVLLLNTLVEPTDDSCSWNNGYSTFILLYYTKMRNNTCLNEHEHILMYRLVCWILQFTSESATKRNCGQHVILLRHKSIWTEVIFSDIV